MSRTFGDFNAAYKAEQPRAQSTGLSADRIRKVVRLFSSNQDGEAGAAAMALHRMIVDAGHDIHWLADTIASALVPTQEPPAEADDGAGWIEVDSYTLSHHRKPGGRPCLRISYRCGTSTYHDFWMVQHTGIARQIACEKWFDLGGEDPPPRTVTEAIDRIGELGDDVEIAVCFDDQSGYWQVTAQRQIGAAS